MSNKGTRYNKGKLRVDLVTPSMISGMAEVLGWAADNKYGERNWQKGLSYTQTYASALRHMLKWYSGKDIDDESGLHHLKHAHVNIGMLLQFVSEGRIDLDDRYGNIKPENNVVTLETKKPSDDGPEVA